MANDAAGRHAQKEVGEAEASVAAGLHRVRTLREGAAERIVAVGLRVLAFVEIQDAPVHAGLQIVRAVRMRDARPRGPCIPRLVLEKRVGYVGDPTDIGDGAFDELIDGERVQVRREAQLGEAEALGKPELRCKGTAEGELRVGDPGGREDVGGVQHNLVIRIGGAAAAADRLGQRPGDQAHVLLRRVASEQARGLSEVLIHADIVFVGVDGRAGAQYVVVVAGNRVAVLVRCGIVAGDLARHGIELPGRDQVAGKRRALARAVGKRRERARVVDEDRRPVARQCF